MIMRNIWKWKTLKQPLLLLQNYQNSRHRTYASMAHQFKQQKTYFYPDRREETQRMEEQSKGQLVPDTSPDNNVKLYKDYYYQLLGVTKDATTTQIKAAYHALAKRYHPDANKHKGNISKRFQEIVNAYQVLVDEAKRKEYDEGEAEEDIKKSVTQTAKPVMRPALNQPGGKASLALNKWRPPKLKGSDDILPANNKDELLKMAKVTPTLELTFLEAIHGIKKIVDMKYLVKCPSCNGKSHHIVSRTESEPCRKCLATGQISKKTATYTALIVCDQCNGKRYINRNQCDLCDSRGFVYETNKVTIHVPHGVKTGDIISVENPHTKQPVNYRINVQESQYYSRIGNNIFTDKYLTISQVVLGGTFKVRGIYGDVDLKVEPGTESHTQFRIAGKGVRSGESYGDHIITVKIRIPQQLNVKQRQLILSLSKCEEPIFEPNV